MNKQGSDSAEDSRSRILASATKIFALKGLDGSRVDEIANDAIINKRMIYHYFGSKEDLYLEVLKSNYSKLYEVGKDALFSTSLYSLVRYKDIGYGLCLQWIL